MALLQSVRPGIRKALHEMPSISSDFDGTPTPRSKGGSDDEAARTDRVLTGGGPYECENQVQRTSGSLALGSAAAMAA